MHKTSDLFIVQCWVISIFNFASTLEILQSSIAERKCDYVVFCFFAANQKLMKSWFPNVSDLLPELQRSYLGAFEGMLTKAL